MTTNQSNQPRSNIDSTLSRTQMFALIQEATSAKNLLRDCIISIRNMLYLDSDADTTFTLGSIGVEKLLKLILGCNEINESGHWPSKQTLSREWGHDIQKLNNRINNILLSHNHAGTNNSYTQRLASQITGSSIIPLLFKTLACYGNSGRFYYLDILATGASGHNLPPLELWEDIVEHITSTYDEFAKLPTENAEIDDYVSRVNILIADELNKWWYCIYRLAQNDYFGPTAKMLTSELWDLDQKAPTI